MSVLVTGAAGFIGFHVARALGTRSIPVIGIDNLNDYYDVSLKEARLELLKDGRAFRFLKLDLADREGIDRLFAEQPFSTVINLAAQAGVRYSLTNPQSYVRSNIDGFLNILEACRRHSVGHLIYASSAQSMARLRRCRFLCIRTSIIRSACTRPARKRTN